ncbi:TPA: lipoprotein, partial [Salmonella enterica subsp. enterica serovar Enteritidis]|nr:lipoprotein [Salmonella enterica subsp. enterica serovar Enteritidis]
MKKILLVAGAALALAGCGEKGEFEKAINAKIGQDKYCFSLDNNNTSFPIRLAKPRLDSTGTGTNSVILDGFIEQGLMVFEQGYDSNVLGITEEGKKAKVWSTTDGACVGRRAVDEIKEWT